jgi:hypothetical protein
VTRDPVFTGFLESQHEQGMVLSNRSDVMTLHPLGGPPPQLFIAEFDCRGLRGKPADGLQVANQWRVGIGFPNDYLRRANFLHVIQLLSPLDAWHPNVRGPALCVGRMTPGTPLVDILYQVLEIITYRRYTPREDDALNRQACAWARANQARFPLDDRPLVRRIPSPSPGQVHANPS